VVNRNFMGKKEFPLFPLPGLIFLVAGQARGQQGLLEVIFVSAVPDVGNRRSVLVLAPADLAFPLSVFSLRCSVFPSWFSLPSDPLAAGLGSIFSILASLAQVLWILCRGCPDSVSPARPCSRISFPLSARWEIGSRSRPKQTARFFPHCRRPARG
jgi:hypothetical protein